MIVFYYPYCVYFLTFLLEINQHNDELKIVFIIVSLSRAGRWQLFESSAKTDSL